MAQYYPNPCNNCGYCCLIQLCKVGLALFGGPEDRACPALKWEGTTSRCGALDTMPEEKREKTERVIGVGEGCSISAKAIAKGTVYNFADLPDDVKIRLAQMQLKGKGITSIRRKGFKPKEGKND